MPEESDWFRESTNQGLVRQAPEVPWQGNLIHPWGLQSDTLEGILAAFKRQARSSVG